MSYKDEDFTIKYRGVAWACVNNGLWWIALPQAKSQDIKYLHMIGYAGQPGKPALYEVISDMSRDCDEILIYDSKGNLLHRMEDKDGVHRGTDQEVHGSADPASSGDQSAGALISSAYTIAPGTNYISWSQPSNTGSFTVTGTGLTIGGGVAVGGLTHQGLQQLYQQAQMQMQQNLYGGGMTMPASTPGYMLGYGPSSISAAQYAQAFGAPDAPKKVIKSEGIRMGEIVAYRCWPIKNGFLWSTAASRAWAPGEPMKAEPYHLKGGLGVYAFKEMSICIQEFGNERFYNEGVAFGTVHLWGEIVEHEKGYRAEYAAIRSIEFVRGVPARLWHQGAVDDLRGMYKVLPKVEGK